MPKKLDVKMYGKMTSVTMSDGPAVVTKISRPDDSVEIVLIDLGLKKAGITRKDTSKNKEMFTTTIDYSDDTKVIAGYKCKKAVVTFTPKDSVDAEEQTLAVFYSPDFSGVEMNADGPYEGITGLLLEFYQVDPGLTTKFVATDIKKGGVKELDFFFQSDYKEFKSGEELMKYLQGQ
jgi:GLPGLI family protein